MQKSLIVSLILLLTLAACGDNSPAPTNPALPAVTASPTSFSVPLTSTSTPFQQTIQIITPLPGTVEPLPTETKAVTTVPSESTPPATATTLPPSPAKTSSPTPVPATPSIPKSTAPLKTTTSPANDYGYIAGKVVAGPTCPVQRIDSPCPPRPISGRAVYIKDAKGTILQTVSTSSTGTFQAQVAPGSYEVEVAVIGVERDHDRSHPVTVVAGQTINLQIQLDTGIR